MNVQDAWTQGVTGKGISVTILDDGIEKSHPDLIANYDPLGKSKEIELLGYYPGH
jgi:subtilisin family serine protease